MSTGIYRAIFPKIAHLANNSQLNKAKKIGMITTMLLLATTLLYCLVLYFSENTISNLLGSSKYNYFSTITILWVIYFVCLTFRNYSSFLLQGLKQFKELTLTTSIISVLCVSLVTLGVYFYSINGGIIAMIISEIVLFAALQNNKKIKNT